MTKQRQEAAPKPGDRVFIHGKDHPWQGYAGELVAYEPYRPAEFGWHGWRIKLDGNNGSCYARPEEMLMGKPRVDSIRYTARRVPVKKARAK